MRHLPFAALVLAATGVFAPVTAQVPAPAVDPGSLLATAGAARYRLSASVALLLGALDPVSRVTFAALLRPDGDHADDSVWQQWAAGAMQIRHEQGDTAQTLWFNPVFDAGIVTRWRRVDGQWRAVAAAPVPGEALRGDHAGATSELPARATPSAVQVMAATTLRAAGTADWNPLITDRGSARTTVLDRLRDGASGLNLMPLWPRYGGAAKLVHAMLVTGDPQNPRLPAASRAALARMGDAARQTLRPVAAWRTIGGWSLVVQSPDAPGIAWFVRFGNPATRGQADPPSLAVVVYNHAGASR